MFTKLSSRSRRIFSALVVFLLVLTAGSFTSCKFIDAFKEAQKELEDMTTSTIYRNWKSAYGEIYTITETSFDNGYYSGSDITVVETDKTSGYIYMKYTKAYECTYTNPDDPSWTHSAAYDWNDEHFDEYWYRYSTTAPDVGKWYAVAYKNLEPASVSLSGAYGAKSSCETLEECKKEMTVENGYFEVYSECKKQ